jgi:protein-S-isoprenylcysteine O-methyltransferase Ste14
VAEAALLLDAVFGLLAVGLRALVHWRRTGQSPFRGGRGISGRVAPLAIAAVLVAGPVLDLGGVLSPLDLGALRGVGIVLMAVGVAATVWAQFAMGESWRIGVDPGERTALVTAGPFRWVRNPIYSAMLLVVFGQALAVPNIASLAGALVVLVALQLHVRRVEEPHLTQVHGAEYSDYAAAVGRFLPGMGRRL